MKGYKIFIKEKGIQGWTGPHWFKPKDWVVKEGEILESDDFDPRIEELCGEGVNFWVDRKSADDNFFLSFATHAVMYEIETIEEEEGDVVRPVPYYYGYRPKVGDLSERVNKARARKVKLLKRIKYWKRKRKNNE